MQNHVIPYQPSNEHLSNNSKGRIFHLNDLPKPDCITEFVDEFRFLSNFWEAPIKYRGFLFRSVEHAYQFAKVHPKYSSRNFDWDTFVENINSISAGEVKKAGKSFPLRKDWKEVKIKIMHRLLILKFDTHPNLLEKLLATKSRYLIEGNTWRDDFWGMTYNPNKKTYTGKNVLGHLLMRIRYRFANPVAILVCGGRDYEDRKTAFKVLDRLNREYDIQYLIQGGAAGADALGREWGKKRRIKRRKHCPAKWKDFDDPRSVRKMGKYGEYNAMAGHIRNEDMLIKMRKYAKKHKLTTLVVGFPGGTGTKNMLTISQGKADMVQQYDANGKRITATPSLFDS